METTNQTNTASTGQATVDIATPNATEPKDLAAALLGMAKSGEGLSYIVKNAKNLPKAEAHEIKAPQIHPVMRQALRPWAWTS